MIDDDHPTDSSSQQLQVEEDVHELYRALWRHVKKAVDRDGALVLRSTAHAGFLDKTLGTLQGIASIPPRSIVSLFTVPSSMFCSRIHVFGSIQAVGCVLGHTRAKSAGKK